MTEKILFWLDAALTNYCMAFYLQKKIDFDFFAIVDVFEKPKKFFQNEKLIDFKKKWFYHDYFKKFNNPDLEYLSKFEEKYKINLWQLAINERVFYRFNDVYKFSDDEILSILEQECKLFEKILDETNPDFYIAHEPVFHHQELLYQMCLKKGIKILLLNQPNIGRCIISQKPRILDHKINFSEINEHKKDFQELQEYRKSITNFNQLINYKNKFKTSNIELIKAAFQFTIFNNVESYYTHKGKTKTKVFFQELKSILKRKYRQSFIDKNLLTEIPKNEKFIYYPLAVDAERNLLIGAPFHTNQIEVIRFISKSIPVDYKLYVKETPALSIRFWRSTSEYKELLDIPNVRLFHPSIPAEKLIENCSLVITITGSTGFDAAFFQKPSIIFSELNYSVLPSVNQINSLEELPSAINDSLKKKVNPDDLNKYLSYIEKNSFEFDWLGFETKYNDFFYFGGHLLSVEIPESKMISFLKENQNILEMLADEHIKKIQEFKN